SATGGCGRSWRAGAASPTSPARHLRGDAAVAGGLEGYVTLRWGTRSRETVGRGHRWETALDACGSRYWYRAARHLVSLLWQPRTATVKAVTTVDRPVTRSRVVTRATVRFRTDAMPGTSSMCS